MEILGASMRLNDWLKRNRTAKAPIAEFKKNKRENSVLYFFNAPALLSLFVLTI
jgi:hypothetical protein